MYAQARSGARVHRYRRSVRGPASAELALATTGASADDNPKRIVDLLRERGFIRA
jgi:hypothetical protein